MDRGQSSGATNMIIATAATCSPASVYGPVQREAEVVHGPADRLEDLSGLPGSRGDQDAATSAKRVQIGAAFSHPDASITRDGSELLVRPGFRLQVPARNVRERRLGFPPLGERVTDLRIAPIREAAAQVVRPYASTPSWTGWRSGCQPHCGP